MFTGIVEELGRVVAAERGARSADLTAEGPLFAADAAHRGSVAVDGGCPTVVEHGASRSRVDVVARHVERPLPTGSVVATGAGVPA